MQKDLTQRFHEKYTRSENGCWVWQSAISQRGYGRFSHKGKNRHAHRVAWEIANGRTIPSGLLVMHSCDNRRCVNPGHLSLGTVEDNNRDCCQKGRNRGAKGVDNGRSKIVSAVAEEIRRSPLSSRKAAKIFGLSASQILRIRRGEQWQI